MTRGQGLSINTIVIVAIALIVLVVLTIIFLNYSRIFGRGLSACKGVCVPADAECPVDKAYADVPMGNCDDGQGQPIRDGTCCVAVS